MYEKANQQLEGERATFVLVFAALALKYGGRLEITAAEIDAAGGREIQLRKNEEEQTLSIEVLPELQVPGPSLVDPNADTTDIPGPGPSKLENPFIMEEENLNPPGMGGPAVHLTDL